MRGDGDLTYYRASLFSLFSLEGEVYWLGNELGGQPPIIYIIMVLLSNVELSDFLMVYYMYIPCPHMS